MILIYIYIYIYTRTMPYLSPFLFKKGSEAALIGHVTKHRGRPTEHRSASWEPR